MVSTPLKNIRQIGNLPQIAMKIKTTWNHQPATEWLFLYGFHVGNYTSSLDPMAVWPSKILGRKFVTRPSFRSSHVWVHLLRQKGCLFPRLAQVISVGFGWMVVSELRKNKIHHHFFLFEITEFFGTFFQKGSIFEPKNPKSEQKTIQSGKLTVCPWK